MTDPVIKSIWDETQEDFVYYSVAEMEEQADHCLQYFANKAMKDKLKISKDKGRYQLLLREHPERVIFFKWKAYINSNKRMPTKEVLIL